jgi:protein-L-isoaspartate(D-aspartate) O-methyltransferase
MPIGELARQDNYRAAFLPPAVVSQAGRDAPLPIGAGQTSSQPSLVKHMVQALDLTKHDRVLEIGTGTGYAASQLARVASHVDTIERVPELAAQARQILARLNIHNVQVLTGDGRQGLPARAPYDAIMVSAEGSNIPQALLHQLTIGGRLLMPVNQRLIRVIRHGPQQFVRQDLGAVRFVPLHQTGMSALAAQSNY